MKIQLYTWLDARRGTYSTLVRHMSFRSKKGTEEEQFIKNYNSLHRLIKLARKGKNNISINTLEEISKGLTEILGEKVSIGDIELK